MSTDHSIEEKAPTEKKVTMRNHWFEHVAKTRKKLTRARKQPVTHREAMREASVTWTSIKDRVRKRMNRTVGTNPRPNKKARKKT
mgnify:CR=1 FL=1